MFKIVLDPESYGETMPEELTNELLMPLMQKVCSEVLVMLIGKVGDSRRRHYVSMATLIGEWGYLCNIAGPAYTCFQDVRQGDDEEREEDYEFDFLWDESVVSLAVNAMAYWAEKPPYLPHKDLLMRCLVISHLKDAFE